jgi:hypothetical protein
LSRFRPPNPPAAPAFDDSREFSCSLNNLELGGQGRDRTADLPLSTLVILVIVFMAAGIALSARRLPMSLVAIVLPAIVAIFFATAFPNRVSQHIENFDRRCRVVALDD